MVGSVNHKVVKVSPNGISQFDRELLLRLVEVTRPYSYAEVARITKFNRETCRRYLTLGSPSIEFVTKLCDGLEVSVHWLLQGTGPVRRDSGAGEWLRAINSSELLIEVGRRWHGLQTTLREVQARVTRLEAESSPRGLTRKKGVRTSQARKLR